MTPTITYPLHIKLLLGIVVTTGVTIAAVFATAASAVEGAEVTTTVHRANHATTTEAAIGTLVHAEARVATTTGTTTPSGTVDFDVYANTSCDGTPNSHNGVVLVGGVAESSTTAVTASGLSYRATYNGDSNNVPSEGGCVSVSPLGPDASISLSLSTTTALVGADVFASAELDNVTANASGTVQYTVYTNSSCSQDARDAGTKTVSDEDVPNSDMLEFNSVDTYYWRAVYSGDNQNDAATSTCSSGRLVILATSTPPNDDDHDEDEDGEGDDNDDDDRNCRLPFGIIKRVWAGIELPFGIEKKVQERFSKWCDDDEDDDNDEDEEDDEDDNKSWKSNHRSKDRDRDRDRGRE